MVFAKFIIIASIMGGGIAKDHVVLKTNYLVVNADYAEPPTAKYKRVLELCEKEKDIQIMDAERFFSLSERQ